MYYINYSCIKVVGVLVKMKPCKISGRRELFKDFWKIDRVNRAINSE